MRRIKNRRNFKESEVSMVEYSFQEVRLNDGLDPEKADPTGKYHTRLKEWLLNHGTYSNETLPENVSLELEFEAAEPQSHIRIFANGELFDELYFTPKSLLGAEGVTKYITHPPRNAFPCRAEENHHYSQRSEAINSIGESLKQALEGFGMSFESGENEKGNTENPTHFLQVFAMKIALFDEAKGWRTPHAVTNSAQDKTSGSSVGAPTPA